MVFNMEILKIEKNKQLIHFNNKTKNSLKYAAFFMICFGMVIVISCAYGTSCSF